MYAFLLFSYCHQAAASEQHLPKQRTYKNSPFPRQYSFLNKTNRLSLLSNAACIAEINVSWFTTRNFSAVFEVKCPLHLAALWESHEPITSVSIIKYCNKWTQKWPWMTQSLWCKFWPHKITHDARANKDVPCSLLPCQPHWCNLQPSIVVSGIPSIISE